MSIVFNSEPSTPNLSSLFFFVKSSSTFFQIFLFLPHVNTATPHSLFSSLVSLPSSSFYFLPSPFLQQHSNIPKSIPFFHKYPNSQQHLSIPSQIPIIRSNSLSSLSQCWCSRRVFDGNCCGISPAMVIKQFPKAISMAVAFPCLEEIKLKRIVIDDDCLDLIVFLG